MKKKSLQFGAGFLAVLLFFSNTVFAHSSENNFWRERSKSIAGPSEKKQIELASLPTSFQGAPSEILNTLPSALPQNFKSALSSQIQKSIPQKEALRLAPLFLALSPNIGSVRRVSVPSKKFDGLRAKTIVHIQDVHMNQEAQTNIGKAVQSLMAGKQIDLMGLEGSFKSIDLTPIRTFDNKPATEIVANYLLKENRISGPVHAAMISKETIPLVVGVDNEVHWKANVAAYTSTLSRKESDLKKIHNEEVSASREVETTFNKELLRFHGKVTDYREGKLGMGEYVSLLSSIVPDASNNVATFIAAHEMENGIDFAKVEKERAGLLSKLLPKLSKAETTDLINLSVAYRLGNIGHADFYRHLKELVSKKDLSLVNYKAMDSYIRYVLLSESINAESLFAELSTLENVAYSTLIKSTQEKSLITMLSALHLSKKLINFELTPDEWNTYRSLADARSKNALAPYESFYTEAEARNTAMTQNLLSAMEKNNSRTAILVTGGFHSPGMNKLLTDAGATVVTFVPKLTKVDSENGSTYLSVFAQEKTPLDRLFLGEKLFVANDGAAGIKNPAFVADIQGAAQTHLTTGASDVRTSLARVRFSKEHTIIAIVAAVSLMAKLISMIPSVSYSPIIVQSIWLGLGTLGLVSWAVVYVFKFTDRSGTSSPRSFAFKSILVVPQDVPAAPAPETKINVRSGARFEVVNPSGNKPGASLNVSPVRRFAQRVGQALSSIGVAVMLGMSALKGFSAEPSKVNAVQSDQGAWLNVNGQLWSGAPGYAYQPVPDGMHINQFESGNMAELYKALLPSGGVGIDAQKYPELVKLAKSQDGAPAQDHARILSQNGAKVIRTYNLASQSEENLREVSRIFQWLHDTYGIMFIAGLYGPDANQVKTVANTLKSNSGLLMYDGWNEVDRRGANQDTIREIDALAGILKEVDPNHPVAIVLTKNFGIDVLRGIKAAQNIDIVGVTIYGLGGSQAAEYLRSAQKLVSPKVVIVSEIGVEEKGSPDSRASQLRNIAASLTMTKGQTNAPAPVVIHFELTHESWKGNDADWQYIGTPSLNAVGSVHTNWVAGPKPTTLTTNNIAKASDDTNPNEKEIDYSKAESTNLSVEQGYSGGTEGEKWLGYWGSVTPEKSKKILSNKYLLVTVAAVKPEQFTGFHIDIKGEADVAVYSLFVQKEAGKWIPNATVDSQLQTDKSVRVWVDGDTIYVRIPMQNIRANTEVITKMHIQSGQQQDGVPLNEKSASLKTKKIRAHSSETEPTGAQFNFNYGPRMLRRVAMIVVPFLISAASSLQAMEPLARVLPHAGNSNLFQLIAVLIIVLPAIGFSLVAAWGLVSEIVSWVQSKSGKPSSLNTPMKNLFLSLLILIGSLGIFNPSAKAQTPETLAFLKNNVTAATQLPLNFKVPAGYWASIGSGPNNLGDLFERLAVTDNASLYHLANFQIVMARNGEWALSDKHTQRLLIGVSGTINNLYANVAPFLYGDAHVALPRENAFLFNQFPDQYYLTDPLDGKAFFPGYPNGDRIRHEVWTANLGENAWAILGELQKAFIKYNGKIPANAPELKFVVNRIPAFEAMRSPSGAVYHVPNGSSDIRPTVISHESNVSLHSSLRQLREVLVLMETYDPTGYSSLSSYIARIDSLLDGIRSHLVKHVYDKNAHTVIIGGEMVNGVFVSNRTYAADVPMWMILEFGAKQIDDWFGPDTAYQWWQETKRRSGYIVNNTLSGIGFSDHPTHDTQTIEWSAFSVEAVLFLADYYKETNTARSAELKTDANTMREGIEAAKTILPDGTVAYNHVNKRQFISSMEYWVNPIPSTIATAWVSYLDGIPSKGDNVVFSPFLLGGHTGLTMDWSPTPGVDPKSLVGFSKFLYQMGPTLTLSGLTVHYPTSNTNGSFHFSGVQPNGNQIVLDASNGPEVLVFNSETKTTAGVTNTQHFEFSPTQASFNLKLRGQPTNAVVSFPEAKDLVGVLVSLGTNGSKAVSLVLPSEVSAAIPDSVRTNINEGPIYIWGDPKVSPPVVSLPTLTIQGFNSQAGPNWFSAYKDVNWDLSKYPLNTKVRFTFNKSAAGTKVRLRLLPKGSLSDSQNGSTGVLTVDANGILEVNLSQFPAVVLSKSTIQVSVHSGQVAWTTQLGATNKGVTPSRVDIIPPQNPAAGNISEPMNSVIGNKNGIIGFLTTVSFAKHLYEIATVVTAYFLGRQVLEINVGRHQANVRFSSGHRILTAFILASGPLFSLTLGFISLYVGFATWTAHLSPAITSLVIGAAVLFAIPNFILGFGNLLWISNPDSRGRQILNQLNSLKLFPNVMVAIAILIAPFNIVAQTKPQSPAPNIAAPTFPATLQPWKDPPEADKPLIERFVALTLDIKNWVSTNKTILTAEQVKDYTNTLSELATGRHFVIFDSTKYRAAAIAQDNFVAVNRRANPANMSLDELRPILAHEAMHVTPRQRAMSQFANRIGADLPLNPEEYFNSPKSAEYQQKLKQAFATTARQELEAYLFEIEIRKADAASKNMSLPEYFRDLAKRAADPTIGKQYENFAKVFESSGAMAIYSQFPIEARLSVLFGLPMSLSSNPVAKTVFARILLETNPSPTKVDVFKWYWDMLNNPANYEAYKNDTDATPKKESPANPKRAAQINLHPSLWQRTSKLIVGALGLFAFVGKAAAQEAFLGSNLSSNPITLIVVSIFLLAWGLGILLLWLHLFYPGLLRWKAELIKSWQNGDAKPRRRFLTNLLAVCFFFSASAWTRDYASQPIRDPHVVYAQDQEAMSQAAFNIWLETVNSAINEKGYARLIMPTGNTPKGLWKKIAEAANRGDFDLSKVSIFMMDEYVQSSEYHQFVKDNFVSKLDDKNKSKFKLGINYFILSGFSTDINKETLGYEKILMQGEIDMVVAGHGENGHLAFNEPGSSFFSRSRRVILDDSTKKANDTKNTEALSIGLATIMNAKKVMVLSSGKKKAPIMAKLHELKKSTTDIPASVLLHHRNATFVIDADAAAEITGDGMLRRAASPRSMAHRVADIMGTGDTTTLSRDLSALLPSTTKLDGPDSHRGFTPAEQTEFFSELNSLLSGKHHELSMTQMSGVAESVALKISPIESLPTRFIHAMPLSSDADRFSEEIQHVETILGRAEMSGRALTLSVSASDVAKLEAQFGDRVQYRLHDGDGDTVTLISDLKNKGEMGTYAIIYSGGLEQFTGLAEGLLNGVQMIPLERLLAGDIRPVSLSIMMKAYALVKMHA